MAPGLNRPAGFTDPSHGDRTQLTDRGVDTDMRNRRLRSVSAAVALVAVLTASGCTGASDDSATTTTTAARCRPEPTGPTTYRYANRPGVSPERTSLDVHLPEGCGPAPVVMWVHGGGWRRGDKAAGLVERKAEWAASMGAALVAVNYRLSTPGAGVAWPDHGEDVADAVAWVQRRGRAVGLDPAALTMVGHSAGAHLVAIVGTDPALLRDAGADPEGAACVVALDFSFDLATAPARALIANAFGTDPAVLASASPTVQVERNGAPDTRFLIGTRGAPRRVTEARAFVDLVERRGGSAELVVANPYDHNQISSRLGAPDDTLVTPPTTRFVESCLPR